MHVQIYFLLCCVVYLFIIISPFACCCKVRLSFHLHNSFLKCKWARKEHGLSRATVKCFYVESIDLMRAADFLTKFKPLDEVVSSNLVFRKHVWIFYEHIRFLRGVTTTLKCEFQPKPRATLYRGIWKYPVYQQKI